MSRKPIPLDDLERDRETTWDGVKNPQALMNLAGMKHGEKLVIYHTVTDKAAVGRRRWCQWMRANPKSPIVRHRTRKTVKKPKTLAEMPRRRFQRLAARPAGAASVVPLTDEQYEWLLSVVSLLPSVHLQSKVWREEHMLRFSTAGESHGEALMALVQGLPAGSRWTRRSSTASCGAASRAMAAAGACASRRTPRTFSQRGAAREDDRFADSDSD